MTEFLSDEPERSHLLELGTATLGECGATPLDPQIHAIWRGASFAAPAFTVACASGDNLAIHAAIPRAPRGTVLAVSFDGAHDRGFWGEVLTTAAESAGIVALVIDGTVRDVSALEKHRFPVFAKGIVLEGATKHGPGAIGKPITIGGVHLDSGDWLVGDSDGVVALGPEVVASCLDAAVARAVKEARFFEQLRGGSTTVELLGLDLGSIEGI
ncbi:MAG: RraA family protein [Acidimicrobiales bacterium]